MIGESGRSGNRDSRGIGTGPLMAGPFLHNEIFLGYGALKSLVNCARLHVISPISSCQK